MLLSVVLSFRNEAENIPELVKRIDAACSNISDASYELIFVNDDSTDDSLNILKDLQSQFPITILNMSRRFGGPHCFIAGFAQAKGEAVIYMDSDLQDPPELIPELVQRFRNGAEVVHTTREKREGEKTSKMLITKAAYRIINYFSEIDLPVDTGDFKLLSARAIKEILNLKEYDPYLRGLSVWIGFRQDFVTYIREPRFGGEPKFPLFGTGPLKEFARGLTAYSAAPLLISLFIGVFVFLISIALIFWSLIVKAMGLAAPGSSGILVAVAFFSGIILITNGIIGLYIAKIYNEIKGRPKYIIKDVINHKLK